MELAGLRTFGHESARGPVRQVGHLGRPFDGYQRKKWPQLRQSVVGLCSGVEVSLLGDPGFRLDHRTYRVCGPHCLIDELYVRFLT